MDRILSLIESTNNSRLLNDLLGCIENDREIRHKLRLKSSNEEKRRLILEGIKDPKNIEMIASFLYSTEYGSDADNDDLLALSEFDSEYQRKKNKSIRKIRIKHEEKNKFHPRPGYVSDEQPSLSDDD